MSVPSAEVDYKGALGAVKRAASQRKIYAERMHNPASGLRKRGGDYDVTRRTGITGRLAPAARQENRSTTAG